MWAQLISSRLKAGTEEVKLEQLFAHLEEAEQAGSGLLRSTAFQEQGDPSRLHMLVVFESEEQARAREADPRRAPGLAAARAVMGEIFDGPPEFTDLRVVYDKARLSGTERDTRGARCVAP